MGAAHSTTPPNAEAIDPCFCEARPPPPPPPVPPSHHFVRLVAQGSCPSTASIRIALRFKNIDPDLVDCDAAGTVPELARLEHGNEVVVGPLHQILGFIESRFRAPPLFPSCCKKAKARCWVAYIRDVLAPLVSQAWHESNAINAPGGFALATALARIESGMSKKGPFFLGRRFTMVDVYLVPLLELLDTLRYVQGLQIPPTHTRLLNYIVSMRSFPAYAPVAMDSTRLVVAASSFAEDRLTAAPLVWYSALQHRSILRHLARMAVDACVMAEDKARRQCKLKFNKNADASNVEQIGSATRLKQLCRDYDRLLLVMQLHAQMEERVIFDALEKAKRGVTQAVIEEHARDLPIMNGIREDFKSVLTLDPSTSSHAEALNAVSNKMKLLEKYTREHFQEEEKDILPLLEAAGLGTRQQAVLVSNCIAVVESVHMSVLPFILAGLLPHEVHGYVVLLHRWLKDDHQIVDRMVEVLRTDEEFQCVWHVVQDRLPLLISSQ